MEDVAMLIVKDGPERGRRWSLDREKLIIGRSAKSDIHIPDRHVSRTHAEITYYNGRYYIQDLGSKNHTYVNGQELYNAHPLSDGDEVLLAAWSA